MRIDVSKFGEAKILIYVATYDGRRVHMVAIDNRTVVAEALSDDAPTGMPDVGGMM